MRRQFAYEAADGPMSDVLKKLEGTFFNTVVDSALRDLRHLDRNLVCCLISASLKGCPRTPC